MNKRGLRFWAVALPLLAVSAAHAHVSWVAPQSVSVGQNFKAVLAVPHGCDGSPTTAVTIHMPEGVIAVKAQPKSGWRIVKTTRRYAQPYVLYGKTLADGVGALTFTGRLSDDEYDEFAFYAHLAAVPEHAERLAFAVEQTCSSGQLLWTDVSGKAVSGHDAPTLPAPSLPLMPPPAASGHHQH